MKIEGGRKFGGVFFLQGEKRNVRAMQTLPRLRKISSLPVRVVFRSADLSFAYIEVNCRC